MKLVDKLTNQKINSHGFTLVEMLVSASILTLTVITVCGIFLSTIGSQRKVGQIANILQDSQFVMESLVKDIRSSEIDYTSPNYDGDGDVGISGTETVIIFKNGSGYQKNGDVIQMYEAPGTWTTITMSTIRISSLYFLIDPQTDPFTHGSLVYQQPRVTIVMTVKPASYSQDWITLQQTVPQRFTERK